MGKWRNLAEQNTHVNDTDPSTHTLHIALDLTVSVSNHQTSVGHVAPLVLSDCTLTYNVTFIHSNVNVHTLKFSLLNHVF